MTESTGQDRARSADESLPALNAELSRAALRAIASTYDGLNYDLFRRALRRPSFGWTASGVCLGRWVSSERRLEISEGLLLEQGWGALVEVLKHEMVHQYVDEVLGSSHESAHGKAFREVCAARGIDARASGVPKSKGADSETTRLLGRVAKLLALAESSNQHEAENATNLARRLMLKHNLETAGGLHAYAFKHLGRPTGRLSEAQHLLALLLQEHFFVKVIWVPVWRPLEGKRGVVLEVCGTPDNLELGAYVFDFLSHTAENLWRAFQRAHGINKNTERRTFLAGVMRGFSDKLESEQTKLSAEGLVWVGDAALRDYYRRRHPRVTSTYGQSTANRGAFQHGRSAGRKIVLHRGVSAGPSGGSRLLKSG